MASNLPMSQGHAERLAADVAKALGFITDAWRGTYDAAIVARELEHVLRREAVARSPKVAP